MIEITNEAKALFTNTSVPKQLVIPFEDGTKVSGINYYTGDIAYSGGTITRVFDAGYWYTFWADATEWGNDFTDFVIWDYIHYAKYLCFSFNLTVYEVMTDGQFILCAKILKKDGTTKYHYSNEKYTVSELAPSTRMKFVIPITDDVERILQFGIYNNSKESFECKYGLFTYKIELGDKPEFEAKYSKCPVLDGHDITDYVTIGNPIDDITNNDLAAESFSMTEALCSDNNIKFGLCESGYVRFNIKNRKERINGRTINPKLIIGDTEIPLGRYTIHSTEKQSKNGLVEKEVIAYDDLTKLEQNAADWYTQYMFGVTTSDMPERFGIEYARQIFSTYFNIASNFGIDSRENYSEKLVKRWGKDDMDTYIWTDVPFEGSTSKQTSYLGFEVKNVDPTKLYVVDFDNIDGKTDAQIYDEIRKSYSEGYDSLLRGIVKTGAVLIKEKRSDGSTNKFCCDRGDYFALSPDCVSFVFYLPKAVEIDSHFAYVFFDDNVRVSRTEESIDLTNAHIRLMYYNWSTREIFPCSSSITGRDVVRSLLEVCGCFYKLDRYGKPRFYYCMKSGLYPSENLYPRDELYPIKSTEQSLNRALYYGFQCEDYEVKDYGRIQIKKDTFSSTTKSIAEWEYVGDSSKGNTYIIEDNIFYCSSEMEYEYDSMVEVSEMLENMYTRISNMGYIPSEVNAVGLPYVECGDRISLLTKDGGIETFVFSRTLSGIQSLVDSFESHGDECNEAISDFGYKEWNEANG